MKKLCKVLFFSFMMFVLWNINSNNVSASSAEISIQSSERQIVKGDVVYVIITVKSSDAMNGFEGCFSYDSRVLQYITGGSVASGNDNQFQISDTGRESGVYTLKYSIKFVARKSGNTSIDLRQPCAVYNAEDSSKMSVSSDTLNIMVKKPEKKTKNQQPTVTEKTKDKLKAEENMKGTPTPKKDMRSETEKPTAKPKETVKETADPTERPKSKKDDTEKKIKKAGNSVTATYSDSVTTIHCYDEYTVTDVKDEEEIPLGYGKTEIVLSGHVITAYATEGDTEHTYVLIYCTKDGNKPEFYLYDTENDSFMPYNKVKSWYKGFNGNTVVGSDSFYDTKIKTMKYIVGIMVIICLLMVIGMITIYLHYRENHNIMDVHYDEFSGLENVSSEEDIKSEDLELENNQTEELESHLESKESNVIHYWKRDL